jgi:hypothetical protein
MLSIILIFKLYNKVQNKMYIVMIMILNKLYINCMYVFTKI